MGKTICPSEVARSLATAEEEWRALMPEIRATAATLHEEGRLRITQRGREVDPVAVRGAIRLGLR